MSAVHTKSDLLAELKSYAADLGLSVREAGNDELAGEAESIRAKWFLGGRKASYRMSCRLMEAEHAVRFREMVSEELKPLVTAAGWQFNFEGGRAP